MNERINEMLDTTAVIPTPTGDVLYKKLFLKISPISQ